MKNKFNWLGKVSKFGVISENQDDKSRRIIYSNVIFISLPIVYIIFMIIDYQAYIIPIDELKFDQLVVPIVIIVCLFCLFLNHSNYTTISRILFISLWPFLLHLIPIKLQDSPSDYLLAYPFGIVFHAILIQLMFSFNKEKVLFLSFMTINLLGVVTVADLLLYYDLDMDMPVDIISHKYYFFVCILYWLLFNLVIFYVMHTVESNIKRLNDAKLQIENQKEELNSINQNLEMLIRQRTKSLMEQNEKLQKHAFFNAHMLRGPFCRIKGLINLKELSKEDDEIETINLKLAVSIDELDSRLHEIQTMVETITIDQTAE